MTSASIVMVFRSMTRWDLTGKRKIGEDLLLKEFVIFPASDWKKCKCKYYYTKICTKNVFFILYCSHVWWILRVSFHGFRSISVHLYFPGKNRVLENPGMYDFIRVHQFCKTSKYCIIFI